MNGTVSFLTPFPVIFLYYGNDDRNIFIKTVERCLVNKEEPGELEAMLVKGDWNGQEEKHILTGL